ncbi:hypothetical protein [Variovorax boronicumulans]
MKNIINAMALKRAMGISLIAALAACSNSPSNGDLKEGIVKNILHDCSLLSIDEFEKINGMPEAQSDRVYQVQVAYTIELEPAKENKILVEKMPDRLLEISDMIDRYRAYQDKYHALNEKLEAESNGDHMGVLKKLNQDPELSVMKKEHDAFEKIYHQYYLYKGDEAQMLLGRMRGNLRRACPETSFSGLMPEKIEDFGATVSKSFEATFTMRKTDNGWQMAR